MNYSKHALRGAFRFAVFLALGSALAACSDDEKTPDGADSGAGGSGGGASGGRGSGGNPTGGTGGKQTGGTGGASGGTGGRATGGTGGTAGMGGAGGATGGTGGKVPGDGGPDADGGCTSPQALYYRRAGCNGSVAPVCAGPTFDACAITVCACDGETITGCGFYEKPWAHKGACTDGADGGDSGTTTDAGDGG